VTKSWREKSKRKALLVSASQITTKRLCNRKWWFEKVRKIPVISSDANVFGTVLHAVAERYNRADDLGRDEKGNPVDLYPEGWEIAYDKYTGKEEGRLTPVEQDTVKRLIDKALEEGILERLPGRSVEEPFNFQVGKLPIPSGGNCTVSMVGFVDLLFPKEVQDHKTSKDKKWFKSKAKLKIDPQMLIYAFVAVKKIQDAGGAVPEKINLRHNQFCKNPNALEVRKTETKIPVVDVLAHWEQVVEDCREMVVLRDTTEQYFDIPDPEDTQTTCRAYGGCPFMTICYGRESPETYEDRMLKYIEHKQPKPENKENKEMTTNPFAAKLAQNKVASAINPPVASSAPTPVAAPAPTPVSTPTPVATPAPVSTPAPAPVQVQAPAAVTMQDILSWPVGIAPWAHSGDPTNGGCGFNEKGEPSQISDALSRQQGGYTSDMFVVYQPVNGMVPIKGKPNTPAAAIAARCQMTPNEVAPVAVSTPKAEPVKTTGEFTFNVTTEPAAPPEAEVIEVEPEVIEVETEEVEEVEQEEAEEPEENTEPARETRKKVGRSKKSFIMLIGVAHTDGYWRKGSGRHVHDAYRLFEDVKSAIAGDNNVESFYDLDVWKRRDRLAKSADAIAEMLGTDILQVASTHYTPDFTVFVESLRPYAGIAFSGISS
jgi:3D (Asp-Asp-Asp) domain-containing protein